LIRIRARRIMKISSPENHISQDLQSGSDDRFSKKAGYFLVSKNKIMK